MKRKAFFGAFIVLLVISILPFANGETGSVDTENLLKGYEIEPLSYKPQKYSGFQIAMSVEQVDLNASMPISKSEDGTVCYFDMSEAESKAFMENASPISMGPNGIVLWMTEEQASSKRTLFIQRDHILIPLLQAKGRGAEDTAGSLEKSLQDKSDSTRLVVDGSVRWSSNGNYLFFYEKNKWLNFEMEDPYLVDTFTGEVFLLESNKHEKKVFSENPYHYIRDGFFSCDSISFVYYLSSIDENGRTSYILKKYDLNSGEITTVHSSENIYYSLVEFDKNHYGGLMREDKINYFVRISTENGETILEKEEIHLVNGTKGELVRYGNGRAILLENGQRGSMLSCFSVVCWDKPVSKLQRMIIRDLDAGMVEEKKVKDLEKIIDKTWSFRTIEQISNFNFSVDVSTICDIAVCAPTEKLLIKQRVNRPVLKSWDGMTDTQTDMILVDIESLKTSKVSMGEFVSYNIADEIIYSDSILMDYPSNENGDKYVLCKMIEASGVKKYNFTRSAQSGFMDGKDYLSSSGHYACKIKSKGDICFYPSEITNEESKVSVSISPVDGNYLFDVLLTDIPEEERRNYIVPGCISIDRYEYFTARMSEENRKILADYYLLITPESLEKLEEKDIIQEYYFRVTREPYYILRLDKEITYKDLSILEKIFASALYFIDDYEIDKKNEFFERFTIAEYPVEYSFSGFDNNGKNRQSVFHLLGLSDQISSILFKYRYNSDEAIEEMRYGDNSAILGIIQSKQKGTMSVENIVMDEYTIDGVKYSVEIISVDDTGTSLSVRLIATPQRKEILGTWYGTQFGASVKLEMKDDGNYVLSSGDIVLAQGAWELRDDIVYLNLSFDEDNLLYYDGVSLSNENLDIKLSRDESNANKIVVADVDMAVSEEDFAGDWNCCYVDIGGILMDKSALGRIGLHSVPTMKIVGNHAYFQGLLLLGVEYIEFKYVNGVLTYAPSEEVKVNVSLLKDGKAALEFCADESVMILYFDKSK